MIYFGTFIRRWLKDRIQSGRFPFSVRSRKRMRSALNALHLLARDLDVRVSLMRGKVIWLRMSGVYSKRWWIERQNIDPLGQRVSGNNFIEFQWMEFPILPFVFMVFSWWWNINRARFVFDSWIYIRRLKKRKIDNPFPSRNYYSEKMGLWIVHTFVNDYICH